MPTIQLLTNLFVKRYKLRKKEKEMKDVMKKAMTDLNANDQVSRDVSDAFVADMTLL